MVLDLRTAIKRVIPVYPRWWDGASDVHPSSTASMAPHVLHPRNLLLLVSFRVGIGKAAPSLPPLGGRNAQQQTGGGGRDVAELSDPMLCFFLLQRHDHDRIRMNKSQSNYLQNLQILFQSRQATVATAQSI